MNRLLVSLASALALAAPGALAAPPTPVFHTPVKTAEGTLLTYGNASLALDGANVYAALGMSAPGEATVRVVKSANSGATWGLSKVVDGSDNATSYVWTDSIRIAVSNDPTLTGRKVLHAVWTRDSDHYYAFYSERTSPPAWSPPARINGAILDNSELNLRVTQAGVIHVVFGRYYTTAPAPGAAFAEPVALPVPPGDLLNLTPTLALDPAGNLYAAVNADNTSIYLVKKPAGASTWSAASTILVTAGSLSNNFTMAAADASNYYVAYYDSDCSTFGNFNLLVTGNGGRTWTRRTVLANNICWGHYLSNPIVAVTQGKVLTYVTEILTSWELPTTVKVWRTSDGGATWSAPATIQGQIAPGLILDGGGKAHVVVADEVLGAGGSFSPAFNLLYIKEK